MLIILRYIQNLTDDFVKFTTFRENGKVKYPTRVKKKFF